LVGADGTERPMPSSGRFELKAGEGFYLDKAGGGGYGEPRQRERAAITRDIAEGYVTPEAAARDYGYPDEPALRKSASQRMP
jgi:N-methylhydantoinase B